MKKLLFIFIMSLLLIIPSSVYALNEVNIYVFYKDNCSICEQEKVYLKALKQDRYPNIRVYYYDVDDSEYYNLMLEVKEMFKETNTTGVPYTVIGDSGYLGFSQGQKGHFQNTIYRYSTKKYNNEVGKKLGIEYRNDLEGEVKEYKENTEYKIEESSDNTRTPLPTNDDNKKMNASIILVSAGVFLLIIYIILFIREHRRGRV